jgi:Fic family protein
VRSSGRSCHPSYRQIPQIDILSLLPQLSAAEYALGRLGGITVLLPRQELFLYMYVRKEAVLSSQRVHRRVQAYS